MKILLLAVVLATILTAEPSRAAQTSPTDFVLRLNQELTQRLGATALGDDERRLRFTALLRESLANDAIGGQLLGRRWRNASAGDRAAFGEQLDGYLGRCFGPSVRGIAIGHLNVIGTRYEGGSAFVSTLVGTGARDPAPLEWRVEPVVGGWRLSDVAFKGISLGLVLEAQLRPRSEGDENSIAAIIDRLRKGARS